MKKEIYYTYQPYKIFTPSFFTDDERLKSVNKVWWWICRLMFWKYKINYHHRFLVKINNYTRSRHFEEDYDRKPRWDEVLGGLKSIAR